MQGHFRIQLHGLSHTIGSVMGAQPLADPAVALTSSAAFEKTKQARITCVTVPVSACTVFAVGTVSYVQLQRER